MNIFETCYSKSGSSVDGDEAESDDGQELESDDEELGKRMRFFKNEK